MYYLDYEPGTAARITEHPTRVGVQDVNEMYRLVARLNENLSFVASYAAKEQVKEKTIKSLLPKFKL